MGKRLDLVGQRFNRLIVLEDCGNAVDADGCKKSLWKCQCDCGNITYVRGVMLRNGKTKSCGCVLVDMLYKHGESKTKLYKMWLGIKHRAYQYPGFCEDWNEYETFKKWALDNGYEDGKRFRRIDKSKGFNPDNCEFINQKKGNE